MSVKVLLHKSDITLTVNIKRSPQLAKRPKTAVFEKMVSHLVRTEQSPAELPGLWRDLSLH